MGEETQEALIESLRREFVDDTESFTGKRVHAVLARVEDMEEALRQAEQDRDNFARQALGKEQELRAALAGSSTGDGT